MAVYYNEHDAFAAAWLRELMADGWIAPGEVDERSIEDVTPNDLRSFQQCHFFAGVGVWSLAARLAGIPDDTPLWSGSCPCQPFSQTGKGEKFDDIRHLWPAFHYLIEQCGPALIVGEQVAGADGDAWLELVSADLDATGYAFGAAETCAAGFGSPHIRSRNYWVAHRLGEGLEGQRRYGAVGDKSRWVGTLAARPATPGGIPDWLGNTVDESRRAFARFRGRSRTELAGGSDADRVDDTSRVGSEGRQPLQGPPAGGEHARAGTADRLDDADGERREGLGLQHVGRGEDPQDAGAGETGGLADADGRGSPGGSETGGREAGAGAGDARDGADDGLADAGRGMLQHRQHAGDDARPDGEAEGEARQWERGGVRDRDGGAAGGLAITAVERRERGEGAEDRIIDHGADAGRLEGIGGPVGGDQDRAVRIDRPGATNGFWRNADWLWCRDEKWRPVESGTFPLADAGAFRNRVGLLRGAGNAITIAQAQGFLCAVVEGLRR